MNWKRGVVRGDHLLLGYLECGRMTYTENANAELEVKGKGDDMKLRWSYRRQLLQHPER